MSIVGFGSAKGLLVYLKGPASCGPRSQNLARVPHPSSMHGQRNRYLGLEPTIPWNKSEPQLTFQAAS
jgi:hypothetical protein